MPLAELRELQLLGVAPGFVAALVAAPWLSSLESLEMTGWIAGTISGLAVADGRPLAAAALPSLKRLVLREVDPGFTAACAKAAWLSRLERLDLSGEEAATPLKAPLPWPRCPSRRS